MIVLRGEHFLVFANAQAVIGHREGSGRVRGQANLVRRLTATNGRPSESENAACSIPTGVGVEFSAEMLDGSGYRLRVRHEQETRQVNPVGRQREQIAHRLPIDIAIGLPDGFRPGLCSSRIGLDAVATTRGAPCEASSQRGESLTTTEGHDRPPGFLAGQVSVGQVDLVSF